MKKLLEVPADGYPITQGISPGMYPVDGTLWNDGRNVEFRDGGLVSSNGDSQIYLAEHDINALAQTRSPTGEAILFHADQAGLWEYRNGSLYLCGGEVECEWSLQPYGRLLVASDRYANLNVWDGQDLLRADAPGVNIQLVRKLAQYIVILGIDDEGARVAWCDQDDPLNWDFLSDSSRAGDLNLRDLGSDIVAAEPLGPSLAVYSADRMGLLNNVGGQFVFGFQPRLNGIGAVSRRAVVSVGQRNFGMSSTGLWVTDGTQYQYLDEPLIRSWLQRRLNKDALDRVVGYHDEGRKQVIWSYPTGSNQQVSESLGYDYSAGTWTVYAWANTAAVERDVLGFPLGARGKEVFTLGSGGNLDSWIQSRPLHCGTQSVMKRLQHLRFGLRGAARYDVGALYDLDGEVDWFWSGDAGPREPIPDREAPYFVLRVSGTDWGLTSFAMLGTMTGNVI